jgi:methylmalonyl-CoA mutase N-terminal domain/subunit
MPWTAADAERHTRKATTRALRELWAKVANECLEGTGDEGRAIREANAVVARHAEPGC